MSAASSPSLQPHQHLLYSDSSHATTKPPAPYDDHYFHELTGDFKRAFVQTIVNIAKRLEIDCEECSQQYMLKLTHRGIVRYTYGYDIGLNNGNSGAICDDKAAASAVLGSHKPDPIPHIEHRLFLAPGKNGAESSWGKIIDFAKSYNFNVVCKPKSGSGGNDVYHVTSQSELEKIAQQLFAKSRDLCICPFYPIKKEIRVIILNGEALVALEKVRPFIVGDGVNSLAQLIIQHAVKEQNASVFDVFSKMDKEQKDQSFHSIPAKGQIVPLSWKHNLAQGASAALIDIPKDYLEVPSQVTTMQDQSAQTSHSSTKASTTEIREVISLAKRAAKVAQVTFGSFDVVTVEGLPPMMMEMNKGIMMENLTRQLGVAGENIATYVFEKAIKLRFALAELENCHESQAAASTDSGSGTPWSSSPPSDSPLISPSTSPHASPSLRPQHLDTLKKFRPSQIPLYKANKNQTK